MKNPSTSQSSERPGGEQEGPESYRALLQAAVSEFSNRGFDGARIEAIARAANYNKSLVYRHFKTKEGLFRAALKFKLDKRTEQLEKAPRSLYDVIVYWFEQTLKDRDYVRMLMGESLRSDGDPVVDDDWRRAYYQEHVEQIKYAQKQGRYPADVDPRQILLLLASIVFFPAVMPQMAHLLTGHKPDSPEFKEGWAKTVEMFARGIQASNSKESTE